MLGDIFIFEEVLECGLDVSLLDLGEYCLSEGVVLRTVGF